MADDDDDLDVEAIRADAVWRQLTREEAQALLREIDLLRAERERLEQRLLERGLRP